MGQIGTMSTEMSVIPSDDNKRHDHLVYSWDKLASESPDDFKRFEHYRTLPGKRSIRQAYLAYLEERLDKNELARRFHGSDYGLNSTPGQWYDMAERNHWSERAAAFDAHQHELDMQVETAERDRCRKARKDALHSLLTASTNALAEIDLSEANLVQASTAIKTAVHELRVEYHDDASTQVEVNAMLAIIPNELRQGILAMLQAKVTTSASSQDNITDNDNDNKT